MGTYYSAKRTAMAHLRRGLKACAISKAEVILQRSNARIMGNVGAEGLALGPGRKESDLAASGYIATSTKSGYDEARQAAMFGRDARRGLWADPATVTQSDREARVKVAYAAGRAALMHDGYHDPRAEHFMFGLPFLEDAAEETFQEFRDCCARVVAGLEDIHALSKEERQANREAAYNDKLRREAARENIFENRKQSAHGNPLAHMASQSQWDEFFEVTESSLTARRKETHHVRYYRDAYTRYPKKGKPVFVRGAHVETKVQRLEDYDQWVSRLEDLFSNWIDPAGMGK